MPSDLLIFAIIAAGLVFWLKNVLGTHDEDEKPGSFFSEDEEKRNSLMQSSEDKSKSGVGNVVSLDSLMGAQDKPLPRHVRVDNKTTENNLNDIAEKFDGFNLHHFVSGVEPAFQIIIEAFAEGDLETLKELLSPKVYKAFEGAIKDRQERGETVETQVKSIEKIDITDVLMKEETILITVRFTARETCVIRDKDGEIISGDPERTTQMVDVWVFSHDFRSEGPEWYLHETRDDEVEDHKTPLPESSEE